MAERKRARRLKPRSEIWDHFTRHTDGDGKEKAQCNSCGKLYAYHGTKNLKEHYDKGCVGQEEFFADAGAAEQPPHAPSRISESSGNLQEEASKHLARMIALRGYDASILEDDCFRSFVRILNPEFEVPTRDAIENMCDGIFDEARRDQLDRLRRAPGKVSLALGRAKTMEKQVFYASCHFIDDRWNLHNLLLDAVITTDHLDYGDGPILGLDIWQTDMMDHYVDKVTDDYGIDDRLFMVAYETTDKDIHAPRHKYSPSNPILFNTYVDNVLHSIARCLLPDDEDLFFNDKLFFDMKALRLTRQERLELLAELGLHYGWAYDERWYARYCSFQVLRKKGFPVRLREFEFIVMAKLLCTVWEKISRAIQKFSSSTRPTANLCLVELFKLREVFQSELEWFRSRDDHEDIQHDFPDIEYAAYALSVANDTLDEAIKDSYLAWSLALAMDPRYKLKFITFDFEKAYGSEAAEEYVSKVTTMITELYAHYVAVYSNATGGGANHSGSASAAQAKTELDRYLKDPLASQDGQEEDFDILNWWKAHSLEYPMVARMARDALAMPTCSNLSSDQMAQIRGILRGYSKKPYGAKPEEFIATLPN